MLTLNAEFEKWTDFWNTKFQDEARFVATVFNWMCSFRNGVFTAAANFERARFSEVLYFHHAEFNNIANFSDASFRKSVDFHGTTFSQRYPTFLGTDLPDRLTLTAKDSHWPSLPSIWTRVKTDVRRHALGPYGLPKTDKPSQEHIESRIQSCAELRHNMTQQGRPEEAHFFFRREMSLKEQIVRWFEKPFYWGYRFLSGYGHGVFQPLVALGVLWAVGAWVFKAFGALSWLSAMGLSFAHIFRFMGFHVLYFEKSVILGLAPCSKVFCLITASAVPTGTDHPHLILGVRRKKTHTPKKRLSQAETIAQPKRQQEQEQEPQ